MRDQPGRAVGVGIEHGGAIAHRLRGVHEHPAELAAADDAEGRAGSEIRRSPAPAGRPAEPGVTSDSAVIARAASVWRRRYASSLARSAASPLASIATANSAALAAPALPMAKVATGMPLGIWTIEWSESTPFRARLATGTPSTGTAVFAASMPGRCAAPPAPAMIALRPRPAARFGVGEHVVGHAVRRDDARFVGDAELGENLGGGAQGLPVAAGAHDHADHRWGAAQGGRFRGGG